MQFELLSSINFEEGNIFLNYTPSDTKLANIFIDNKWQINRLHSINFKCFARLNMTVCTIRFGSDFPQRILKA